MADQYISLGAACNAAKMVKKAGLRKASYPFDWLLNLDDGLTAVIDIIQDDFEKVAADGCYDVVYHRPVGRSVPAYKDYPNTYHVHSDPASNLEDHQEILRRFDRFRRALRSSDNLHFVYYRNLSACRDTHPDISPLDVANLMLTEATRFLKVIDPLRRGQTYLLMVLECDVEHVPETDDAVRKTNLNDNRISFGRAISRYDDDASLNMRWQHEWLNLIATKTHMPTKLQMRYRIKRSFRSLKKNIRQRVKAIKAQMASL